MAQVRKNTARISEFSPRPDMVPHYSWWFSPVQSERPMSKWHERPETRRSDARVLKNGPTQSYGTGTPAMNSSKTCDISGVGVGRSTLNVQFPTEEGPVLLPVASAIAPPGNFLPTSENLEHVMHFPDSRILPTHTRYYT